MIECLITIVFFLEIFLVWTLFKYWLYFAAIIGNRIMRIECRLFKVTIIFIKYY